jgi:GAF domain-containing protein
MSDSLPFTPGALPEANSPLFLAMRDIARATSPAQIVDALRTHALSQVDRISLVQVEKDMTSATVGRVVATWDRDGIAPDIGFPSNLHEMIEDQPLVVVDTIYLDEFLAPLKLYAVDLLKASSFGIFPLKINDAAVGYLVVASRQTRLQDDQEVRLLLMLCWQIAAMMHSFQVDEAHKKQAARTLVLAEASQSIAGSLTTEELGEALTAQLKNLLSLAHLSTIIRLPDTETLHTINWFGPDITKRSMLNNALFEQILRSGETAFLGGMSGPEAAPTGEGDVQKLLVIPMGVPGDWIGTLNIGIGAMSGFGPDDRKAAELVAQQAGAALAKIRIVEHLQNSLQETTTLYSTSLALTASQSIDEITSTTLSELAELSKADRITLYLAGPDPREAVEYVEVTATWKNDRVLTPSSMRYPIGEAPVLAQFPQSRSNLIFNDIQADSRLSDDLRAYYDGEKVNALLMIPLSTGATWLGAFLIEAQSGQQFTNEQARLCRSLADQAALALDSQLLLTRTRQAVGREKALRDITDRIRRSISVDEILTITGEELAKFTGLPASKFTQLSMTDSMQLNMSQSDREFVQNVIAQVELAINNIRLLDNVRQTAQAEQAIGNLTVELQRASEVNEVMETAVRTLQGALGDFDVRIRLLAPPTPPRPLGTGRLNEEVVEEHEKPGRKSKTKKLSGTEPLN